MTARSLAWDGLVIGGTFAFIYGSISLTLACIGTHDRDEVRPVLAVMSWWRAHRLPLLGLLFPGRGRHAAGDGWHPLDDDEEAGDGVEGDDQEDQGFAGQHGVRAVRSPAHGSDPGEMPPARGGDGSHGEVRDQGHHDLRAEAGNEDLSGLSAEDTDTLRAIRALNAEHLVPTNEPDHPGPADPDWQCPACDRWFTNHDPRHDLCVYCRSRSPEDHPGPDEQVSLPDVDTAPETGPGDTPHWHWSECEQESCEYGDDCPDKDSVKAEPSDPPGPAPGMDVDTSSGHGPGADRQPDAGRFTSLMRALRRDGPARFWTAQNMSECAQTAALLALADSILAGGAA